MRSLYALVLLASAGLCGAGCISDSYGDPLPGHEVRMALRPGLPPELADWPVAYRRSAEFRIVNRSGEAVETLLLDFPRAAAAPRELTAVTVLEPTGLEARVLPAPHGTWPLRALVGIPGRVLLPVDGEILLRLDVAGTPGRGILEIRVPGRTPH